MRPISIFFILAFVFMSNATIIPVDKLEAEAMEVGPQPAEALTNSDD